MFSSGMEGVLDLCSELICPPGSRGCLEGICIGDRSAMLPVVDGLTALCVLVCSNEGLVLRQWRGVDGHWWRPCGQLSGKKLPGAQRTVAGSTAESTPFLGGQVLAGR